MHLPGDTQLKTVSNYTTLDERITVFFRTRTPHFRAIRYRELLVFMADDA